MLIPKGKTEKDVLDAINKAVNSAVNPSLVFGYHSLEDIKQQARQFALEALARYDPERQLAGFLYVHICNRLKNFYRDEYRRNDSPCKSCQRGNYCDNNLNNKGCQKFQQWEKLNNAKANIMRPVDIGDIDESSACLRREESIEEEVIFNECLRLIDEHLPAALRADYLRLRDGVKLPKQRRIAVENEVREILRCQNEAD